MVEFKSQFKLHTLKINCLLIKTLKMNINDKNVLEMLNKFIAIDRLNNSQILQMVNLVSISDDINDLKDNLKWESSNYFY